MNILHMDINCHYTEGMLYQDNALPKVNADDGHNVTIITDVYAYVNGKLEKVGVEDKIISGGIRLIRVEYDRILNDFVTRKIQKVSKIKKLLEEIRPDSILYHGICGYELMDVAAYVKNNPHVLFYADSHEDFFNTARTPIAKFAYKYIHGYFVKKSLPYIKKVLYLGEDVKIYLKEMYSISDDILEFYPLGGFIEEEKKQLQMRQSLIEEFNLPQDAIICAHSGKMDAAKKTKELLEAFESVDDERMYMFLFGSIPDDMKSVIMPLVEKSPRVFFLGWKNNKELVDILDGVDLYCQPGSMSATFQVSVCCGCATMLYPSISYKKMMGRESFFVETKENIKNVFIEISRDRKCLNDLKARTFEIAKQQFDYVKLARRIYV